MSINAQITTHTNADNDACAEMETNEQALFDLFENEQALFSDGYIDLVDVVERAFADDKEFITEILCELAVAKVHDTKKHSALSALYKKRLCVVALEMNKQAA